MNKDNGWDASASWNGYMYQGKVALLVLLETINKIKNGDCKEYDKYWIESEGIEDFAIGHEDRYLSIHQVKNRQDKKLDDYAEALSNIVNRLRDYTGIKNGYLHTKTKIEITDWDKSILELLMSYYPNKIQKLRKIYDDNKEFENTYKRIVDKYNDKKNDFNYQTSDINKLIMKKIYDDNKITSQIDLTKEIVKEAIKKVLEDEKSNYEFTGKEEAIKKIKLYKYTDGNEYDDSLNIIKLSEEEIKKYWDEYSEYREPKLGIYYIKLLEIINNNITERAEKKTNKTKISLSEFVNVLETESAKLCSTTKEEKLLELKSLFLRQKDTFCSEDICEVKSINNCEKCSLNTIYNVITTSNLKELEAIFRIMALHKQGKITEPGVEIVNADNLDNPFFMGITTIDKEFFMKEFKVLCEIKDKYLMATTIFASTSKREKGIIKGLLHNDDQIVCNRIINNKESDTSLMEIDKLLTANVNVDDVFQEACNINEIDNEENDDKYNLKYMNITKTKKVGLISIDVAKSKYGERKL